MITVRKSGERGRANHGWLDSHHTFSFADYYDPRHMGFRDLRVINQDIVLGGHGFPMHPHQEMEIISYVLEGQLEHEDTMGSKSVIGPGEAQVISAGAGMAHSERNPSRSERVHFLQVWIVPARDQLGQPPLYAEGRFAESEWHDAWRLICSGDGRDGSVPIRQDADVLVAELSAGAALAHTLRSGRGAWLHVASGGIELNGHQLDAGDGAAVEGEPELRLAGRETAELMLFDLP
jgi:redox-sensitive bicupin YhaK (pirin superfamily)